MIGHAKAPSTTSAWGRLGLACIAILAIAALNAAPAPANVSHPFLFKFGPSGSATSKFLRPDTIAVDQGSHDVFVLDDKFGESEKGTVARFTSAGKPDKFTAGPFAGTNMLSGFSFRPENAQVAIAPPGAPGETAEDIYVASQAGVDIYSPAGAHLGHLGTGACGATTDSAGNLYVGIYATGVEKYVPTKNPVVGADFNSKITTPGKSDQTAACTLSAGSNALYAGGATSVAQLVKYDLSLFPGGGGSEDATGKGTEIGNAHASYVDPSNDDVYVALKGHNPVLQLDKEGNGVSVIAVPNNPEGVAVDATSGDVYVANYESQSPNRQVYVFGPGEPIAPPTATIDPVTTFTYHSAHFSGTVNSGGAKEAEATTYRFQCTPECPGLQGPRSVPTDGLDHEVSDESEGLEPETTYEVTLIATSTGGESKETTSFETPAKPVAIAPVVTIDPVTTFSATTAHLSGTVDPGGLGENQATAYRFEYSLDDSKWSALKEQGPIEGLGSQAVSAELEGLEPNTAYFVRLRAENVGGVVFSKAPDPSFTTTAVAPLAETTAATHVLTDSAQLNARLNPQNSATTYYFQWGTGDCASSPCTSVPLTQDAEAGSGNAYLFVDAQVTGLSPGTTYFYRLVAENVGGEAATPSLAFTTEAAPGPCPNEALRSGPSANLPDCRAYEMVSPPDKGGADVTTMPRRTRVAADGNAINYQSTADFGGSEGSSATGIEYLSSRSADGWSTHSIFPHQSAQELPTGFNGSNYVGNFTPDLSKGVFSALAPIPGAGSPNVDGQANLYLGTDLRGEHPSFRLLSDSTAPLGEPDYFETTPHIKFASASADLSHVIFEDTDNLTPDASGTENKLYESVGGAVRLAGILPDSACGSLPCPAPASIAGSGARIETTFSDGMDTELSNTISDDGSRVFFTAGALTPNAFGDEGLSGHLYVRENGATTTQLDASERTDCANHNPCSGTPEPDPKGPGIAEFQFATPDGAKVFFISSAELTNEDTDGSRPSLYRYDTGAPAGHHLTLLPTAAVVPSHVVGISDDGSYLYFTGNDPTDPVPEEARHGPRLYLLHNGSLRKIAIREGFPNVLNWGDEIYGFGGELSLRVSPDGRHLVFISHLDQRPPNQGHLIGETCPNSSTGSLCSEIFLYSADSDQLVCASCNPSGAPPTADANFVKNFFVGPGGDPDLKHAGTPMSNDGRYVFFNTADPLVPQDSNGQLDAYEYDSETGKLHLLSSGQCNCPSAFVTASPDGHDVFFTTRQHLVRADTDNLVDVYDARIGGGIASQNAVAPAQCEGDACLAAPSPPLDATPGSAGFSGPGNPAVHKKHKHHKRHHHKRSHKSHHRARAATGNPGGAK